MGPLISAAHRDSVAVVRARGRPDRVPRRRARRGRLVVPADRAGAGRPDDPAFVEEVFGPVVAVVPFDDEADAIRIANDTPYGLSGSIWTQRPRPGAPRRPRRRDREPVGQLALVGAVLDAVRRLQAVGHRAASSDPTRSTAFTDVKNVFIATEEHT